MINPNKEVPILSLMIRVPTSWARNTRLVAETLACTLYDLPEDRCNGDLFSSEGNGENVNEHFLQFSIRFELGIRFKALPFRNLDGF